LAVITNRIRIRPHLRLRLPANLNAGVVVMAAALLLVARLRGWWPVAALLVVGVELSSAWKAQRKAGSRTALVMERLSALVVGVSVVLIIALVPRLVTQVAVAGMYAAWRLWWGSQARREAHHMLNLLVVQVVMFEAVFLMAPVWQTPAWLTLVLIWAGAYGCVYVALARRGERAAAVLAATWALVCLEVSWSLGLWLFTYTTAGGYGLVPQPALVLSALAYCFGSIYMSQRQGVLSRTRLTEYLLIGLIMIVIVAVGTSWRGSI